MYFHGTKTKHPGAIIGQLHIFWVYPEGALCNTPPQRRTVTAHNPWDTMIPAEKYCNNCIHVHSNPVLQEYICCGHTSLDDMSVAQNDWETRKVPSLDIDNPFPVPANFSIDHNKIEVALRIAMSQGDLEKVCSLALDMSADILTESSSDTNTKSILEPPPQNISNIQHTLEKLSEHIMNYHQHVKQLETTIAQIKSHNSKNFDEMRQTVYSMEQSIQNYEERITLLEAEHNKGKTMYQYSRSEDPLECAPPTPSAPPAPPTPSVPPAPSAPSALYRITPVVDNKLNKKMLWCIPCW